MSFPRTLQIFQRMLNGNDLILSGQAEQVFSNRYYNETYEHIDASFTVKPSTSSLKNKSLMFFNKHNLSKTDYMYLASKVNEACALIMSSVDLDNNIVIFGIDFEVNYCPNRVTATFAYDIRMFNGKEFVTNNIYNDLAFDVSKVFGGKLIEINLEDYNTNTLNLLNEMFKSSEINFCKGNSLDVSIDEISTLQIKQFINTYDLEMPSFKMLCFEFIDYCKSNNIKNIIIYDIESFIESRAGKDMMTRIIYYTIAQGKIT